MTNKRIIASVLLLTFAFTTAAITSAGTASDPLLTLSYFTQTYLPGVASKVAERFDIKATPLVTAAGTKAETVRNAKATEIGKATVAGTVGEATLNALIASGDIVVDGFRIATFSLGETVSASTGTAIYLENGTVVMVNGPLVNLSAGRETAAGNTLVTNVYYLFPENNTVTLSINSATAVLRIRGSYTVKAPYAAQHTELADALKLLGLFRGTNKGYELAREATRLEGLIMLIRLMGEEEKALNYTGSHPFRDVPTWAGDTANKYVAYAYDKGYTNGMSATEFGSIKSITGVQYVTMVLRALGYDDAAGDFVWDKSFDKGVEVGLYTKGQVAVLAADLFRRDQVVEASCNALFINLKDTDTRLIDYLHESNVFSRSDMLTAVDKIAEAKR